MESNVKDHYSDNNLSQKIKIALNKAGKDIKSLTLKDLAPVDQLHTGGAFVTLALLKKTTITPASYVLDAGCGIGGSTRLIAQACQYQNANNVTGHITGIDLSDSFIETAKMLTHYTKLEDHITYKTGSILTMTSKDKKIETNKFDAIFCQHVLMNIQNKKKVLKEFYQALKPGGELILHEITQGENSTLAYPVPWAATSEISFLETWNTLNAQLTEAGFKQKYICDETMFALNWWKKIKVASKKNYDRPRYLGPHLVFGKNATFFEKNMSLNFKNNTVKLIEAIFTKNY